MRVGFYQFDVQKADPSANLRRVATALAGQRFDLLVLPELFTTGYMFDDPAEIAVLAEPIPGGETCRVLSTIAAAAGGAVIGTLPEREGDRVYNTAVVMGPTGWLASQRKVHLSSYEKTLFRPGDRAEPVQVAGTLVGVITCFDSWFPEMSRLLVRQGAQILCQPASFGGTMTLSVIRARAIENLVYTITANRIGRERSRSIEAEFRGESRIIGPDGGILAEAGGEEALRICEINPALAREKVNEMCDFPAEWARYRVRRTGRNRQ